MKKFILIFVMLVFAGQAWAVNPESIAKSYINAQKKKDYVKLYQMDYMEGLVGRSFGSKSMKSGKDLLMEERLPAFIQEKAFPTYFPASMQFKITEVIKNVTGYNYYEKYKKWVIYGVVIEVSYPNKSESPDQGGQLVKKAIIGLSIDGKSGNIIESSVTNSKIIESYGLSPREEKRQRDEQAARVEQESQKKAHEEKVLRDKQELERAKKAAEGVYADTSTGLMWTIDGDIAEKETYLNDAEKWVSDLDYSGYNDWRLPTKKEIKAFAKLDKKGFGNVRDSCYWTATKAKNEWPLVVDMSNGKEHEPHTTETCYVWPVRGAAQDDPAPAPERKAKKSKAAQQRENSVE